MRRQAAVALRTGSVSVGPEPGGERSWLGLATAPHARSPQAGTIWKPVYTRYGFPGSKNTPPPRPHEKAAVLVAA